MEINYWSGLMVYFADDRRPTPGQKVDTASKALLLYPAVVLGLKWYDLTIAGVMLYMADYLLHLLNEVVHDLTVGRLSERIVVRKDAVDL